MISKTGLAHSSVAEDSGLTEHVAVLLV